MKFRFTIFLSMYLVTMVSAQSPDWEWVNSHGGSNYEWGQCVAKDAAGNIVLGGAFHSPIFNLGGTVFNNPDTTKHSSFIVKYDAVGNVVWAKQPIPAGGQIYNRVTAIDTDNQNNIYVTGIYFSNSLTFDGVTITNNHCCLGAYFLVKYNALGALQWATTTGGAKGGGWPYPPQPYAEVFALNKIAVNKSTGQVYMTGTYDSTTMTLGSTVLINNTTNTQSYPANDVFIAKYGISGNVLWARSIGGARQDHASDLAVNNSEVVVTGAFSSPIVLVGPYALINPNQSSSWDNHLPFVVKYDAMGNPVWAKQGNATLPNYRRTNGKNLAIDGAGNTYLSGEFESPFIYFDNDTLFNTDTIFYSSKVFAVKYNSQGNVVWTKNFANGTGNDWSQALQIDSYDNVYVAGTAFSNFMAFDSIALSTSGGGMFVTKIDPSGNVLWAKAPGGNGQTNYLTGMDVSPTGRAVISGGYKGKLYFGNDTMTAGGQSDIFLASISHCAAAFSVYPTSVPHDWIAINHATGVPPLTYTWNWGDGSPTSFGPAPSHIYASPGFYNICLTITDGAGCSQTYCDASTYLYRSSSSNQVVNINVVGLGVGVEEQADDPDSFFIYPNPSNGTFTLMTSAPYKNSTIEIYNLFGETVYREEMFDISTGLAKQIYLNQPSGIYLLRWNNNGKYFTRKLVVQ